jgi:peptidoglycan/LPS O-acetylase OafA/YrhL
LRVPIIDGLRGAAILLVLSYHVYEKSHFAFGVDVFGLHLNLHTFIQAGYMGVEIFFFVSGFCLMLPYAQYLTGRRTWQSFREYTARRFWKIVPSYYLALLIIALVPSLAAQTTIPRLNDLALHAVFLHSFNDVSFTSLNGNFWSLAVEVQFYVLFPFIVIGFARRPAITIAATILIGLAYSTIITNQHRDVYFQWSYDLLAYLPLFALGIASAYVYEKWVRDAQPSQAVQREMVFVSFASVLVLAFVFEQADRIGGGFPVWAWQNGHRFEIALILCIFTLSSLLAAELWQRVVANPVLRFYADISYNMYLWNAVVVSLIAARWFGDEGRNGLIMFALTLVGTTAVGWALTRFFERPLMRWSSERRRVRTTELEPSTASALQTSG